MKANEYSPLVLAYIGDAVYELFVRRRLAEKHDFQVDKLHKAAISIVNANAQAQSYRIIENILTEEESAVYKRGRNTKSSVPKNADVINYRTATGLEALIGYIFLKGDNDRLVELMNLILRED